MERHDSWSMGLRRSARALAAIAAAAATFVSSAAAADDAQPGPPLRCERLDFSVGLGAGQPNDQTVVGWLCSRGAIDGRTVQVLLHGGTYDHDYWDFPLSPERYSYVRALTDAGYATLNLDRLGSGLSSRPDPSLVTIDSNAYTIHRIVGALRSNALVAGSLGTVRPGRIMLVGHSIGSYVAVVEDSTYQDVDALVLTGYSHVVGPGIAVVQSSAYPAAFDSKFAALQLPYGYLTTIPGTRGNAFYDVAYADPAVIAEDEQLKQTVTTGELGQLFGSYAASSGVRVSTFVVDGEHDTIDCNGPSCSASGSLTNEAASFGAPACVDVVTVPFSGHDLNLHRNAQVWYAAARMWSDLHVGVDAKHAPLRTCTP